MRWFLLALRVSAVVAGGDGGYESKASVVPAEPLYKTEKYMETKIYTTTEHIKWEKTLTETSTEHVKWGTTLTVPTVVSTTVTIPQPYGVTETKGVPQPYAVTVTEFDDVAVPTTVYNTVPTTVYLTETDFFTSLTTEPAVTVFITTTTVEIETETETEVPPPVTLTTTELITSSQCEFCKIDIYATALVFPTSYIFTTVYEATIDIYKTVYDDLNSTLYSTSTILAPPPCSQNEVVTTWEYSSVVLTSPTTYLAYTDFSRGFLEPRPTVYGCGELVFVDLELGPAQTSFAELVIATTVIPTTPTDAPQQLLRYLDTLPTVVQQVDGVPAYSCDTPAIVTVELPPASQVTVEATESASGTKTRYKTAQHVIGALASSVAAAVSTVQALPALARLTDSGASKSLTAIPSKAGVITTPQVSTTASSSIPTSSNDVLNVPLASVLPILPVSTIGTSGFTTSTSGVVAGSVSSISSVSTPGTSGASVPITGGIVSTLTISLVEISDTDVSSPSGSVSTISFPTGSASASVLATTTDSTSEPALNPTANGVDAEATGTADATSPNTSSGSIIAIGNSTSPVITSAPIGSFPTRSNDSPTVTRTVAAATTAVSASRGTSLTITTTQVLLAFLSALYTLFVMM